MSGGGSTLPGDQPRPGDSSSWSLIRLGLVVATSVMVLGSLPLWSLVRPAPDPVGVGEASAVTGAVGLGSSVSASESRLNEVTLPAGAALCPHLEVRRPAIRDEDLAAYLQSIADCLTAVNAEPMARQGLSLDSPRVRTFQREIETPCGPGGRYAFYCPQDRTIYVDSASDEGAGYGAMPLGYFVLISHEYAHHLQLAGGVTTAFAHQLANSPEGEPAGELTRRAELQATCFSGVTLAALQDKVGARDADPSALENFFAESNDQASGATTHGSASAMTRWYSAGYSGRPFGYGRCNTWQASADLVR